MSTGPNKIAFFFKKYSNLHDRLFITLMLLLVASSACFLLMNTLGFHYTAPLRSFYPSDLTWIKVSAFVLIPFFSLVFSMYARKHSPRASTFMGGMGSFVWLGMGGIILINGIQATPFSPIDIDLLRVDHFLGINILSLMAWTHTHPMISNIFQISYESLAYQIVLIPLFLGIFNARRVQSVFYLSFLIVLFTGGLIYYFFPTMAPSGILHSPYFSEAQRHTSQRFYEIHHVASVTAPTDGGMVAFPSFHVAWAVLLSYALLQRKLLFSASVILNTCLICATFFLGWHYFTDVLAGFFLAITAILIAEWVWRKDQRLVVGDR